MEDINSQGSTSRISNANKNSHGETSTEVETFQIPFVDESHVYKLSRKFVRIEYPGFVKNIPKALDTLGGLYNIEIAISDPKKRLELKFHPENKFNKPCASDRDGSPGLVIEVTKDVDKIDYKIIGYTFLNFKFNKAVDFQYLPLVQDEKSDDVQYVHNKIFPAKLPTIEFLTSKESMSQAVLILPSSFSKLDITHQTLYLNAKEKFNSEQHERPTLLNMFSHKKPKAKYQFRAISYLANINDPNLEIPTNPNPLALKIVKDRLIEDNYKRVKKLFDERPIWSRAAIQHKSGITNEMTKVLLPANAYFWTTGPWRMTWTKFGVDPRQDFSLKIYQTLDFRIRAKEGTKIKVKAKRPYVTDNFSYTKQSYQKNPTILNEDHYILSPDSIPPARQMFYQYCDIKIPEIQDMVQRLPKTPVHQKFDTKTGWLPLNFAEQCREIANRYVLVRVRQELIEDALKSQSNMPTTLENDTDEDSFSEQENPLSYSSGMLDKMKTGSRRKLNIPANKDDDTTVVLTDDETGDEMDIDESIPASIYENSDSDDSEMELDMEALEEINQIISESQKDD